MRRYASTNPFVEAERRKPEDTMREGDEMSGAELSTRRPISFFFSIMVYIQQFTKMDGSCINDKVLVRQPPLITSISTRKYSFAWHKHI